MKTACYDCGMQCRECVPNPRSRIYIYIYPIYLFANAVSPSSCIAVLGPECNACPRIVCVKHALDRNTNPFCSHCPAVFCEVCADYPYGQMSACAICNDSICPVSWYQKSAPFVSPGGEHLISGYLSLFFFFFFFLLGRRAVYLSSDPAQSVNKGSVLTAPSPAETIFSPTM